MKVDIITLFPDIFFGPFSESIVARAIDNGSLCVNTVDLRLFAEGKRRQVDDKPYGGGPGMLLMAEPVFKAVEALSSKNSKILLMTPQGRVFNQEMAGVLSNEKHLVIICGHYEGVDERIRESLVDMEVSIGDYVLTSGNLPAMVLVDAVTRLLPGVLGSETSVDEESFSDSTLLEYPQYTRPELYNGMKVPDVLLSGNHGEIAKWRLETAKRRTAERRPDLPADRGRG
ncbi:MAG: tRNA (guanosine(37)-N1)-methyltransferase TrmD [Kiritimatiellaeota bacterium]|nr:tRNA (guanosine(37)-N1)-methyltransferase TrmD [Kiritimatiellota bacterium]